MQIKKKAAVKAVKSTEVAKVGEVTEIRHTQAMRVSYDYSSAECSYGVTLKVNEANPASVAAGIKRAEELVEAPLVDKVAEHLRALKEIAAK